MKKDKHEKGEVSRRDFLIGAGAVVVGGAIGAGITYPLVAGKEKEVEKTVEVTKTIDVAGPTVTSTAPGTTVTSTAPGTTVISTVPGPTTTITKTAVAEGEGPVARVKRLEVGKVNITKVELGASTKISGGVLTVNAAELKELLLQDPRLGSVDIDVVNPGENTRIVRIVNTYEARARTGDRKGEFPFPAALGPGMQSGEGSIVALKGLMVHICNASNLNILTQRNTNFAPDEWGPKVAQGDGPTEGECNANSMCAVVLVCKPDKEYEFSRKPDLTKRPIQDAERWAAAIEMAGMRTAAYLGRAAEDLTPDEVEVLELPAVWGIPRGMEDLPKVAYISFISHHNCPLEPDMRCNTTSPLLYGGSATGLQAEIIHPNNYIDGAVLRPHDFHGDTAYDMQNDPILLEMYRRHGKDLCFVGVVLTQNNLDAGSSQLANMRAVDLAADILGADGVVVNKPGGGAPHESTAKICSMCELRGVSAVAIRMAPICLLYANPEPSFGIIATYMTPSFKYPAVTKVIGYDDSVTNPGKGEITTSYFPIQNRGGEKYQDVPQWYPLDAPDQEGGFTPWDTISVDKTGATRAVDMIVAKATGQSWETELDTESTVPPPITAAPGITDITKAKIAFICGGGFVKVGETPFAPSYATDGRFAQYDLTGMNTLKPEDWEIHHGGYTEEWAKEDPHRVVPLPQIRELLAEGKFGSLDETLYSWSSLVGTWICAVRVGEGIIPLLKAAGVDGVITDST